MKEKNNNISSSIIKKSKQLVKKAKEKELIKPLTDAFDKYNVEEENHKGKVSYFSK